MTNGVRADCPGLTGCQSAVAVLKASWREMLRTRFTSLFRRAATVSSLRQIVYQFIAAFIEEMVS